MQGWLMAVLLATPGLGELAFLVGAWEGTQGRARFEEHWVAAEGGLMLGLSRTLVGDKAVSFEFLRIEARADGVYYVAQPGGRPPTDFRLTALDGASAVFENPQHDHPKLIRYRRGADGSLTAEIEGDEQGRHVVEQFRFRPKPR